MRFTKEYYKLSNTVFTTIRKNTGFYKVGKVCQIRTPKQEFQATVIKITPLKKKDITPYIANRDAEVTPFELIKKLEKWYGKEYDDFVLIRLARRMEKTK